jgi:predicted RecA/RadA family phage recombinase
MVGRIFGVAQSTYASGAVGEFQITGVIDIKKTTSTFADGDPVYWDNSNKYCTSTAQSNWLIGRACLINSDGSNALGTASGDATVRVRLSGDAKAVFKSTEQTGTGSAQNVAHGLGVTPGTVIIFPTDTSPATTGTYVVTEGTHDGTNVVVTVTTSKKFKAVAFSN